MGYSSESRVPMLHTVAKFVYRSKYVRCEFWGLSRRCGRGLGSSGVVQHHGPEEGNPQILTQIYTIIALSHAF